MSGEQRIHSIMQSDMSKCYVCGTTLDLCTHEIYYGLANRPKSIKWGCYVRLCNNHHNMSNDGVHFNPKLDKRLKEDCQKAFEREYGHTLFMSVFHKNYL